MNSEEKAGLLLRVIGFAAEKHRDGRRKDPDASPSINHSIAVATVLWYEVGITDLTVIAAAILHDTVEDTETTVDELKENFGDSIASVVAEVTDDKLLPKAVRKISQVAHAPNLSEAAQQLKIADKICNLRDVASAPPSNWSLERSRDYFDWAVEVVDSMPSRHGSLSDLFDQVSLLRP